MWDSNVFRMRKQQQNYKSSGGNFKTAGNFKITLLKRQTNFTEPCD